MAAALHFDLSVHNFGIQELMPHTADTDRVFPHAYTFESGFMHPGDEARPRRRDRRSARRDVPVRASLPARRAKARWHAPQLVGQSTVISRRSAVVSRSRQSLSLSSSTRTERGCGVRSPLRSRSRLRLTTGRLICRLRLKTDDRRLTTVREYNHRDRVRHPTYVEKPAHTRHWRGLAHRPVHHDAGRPRRCRADFSRRLFSLFTI